MTEWVKHNRRYFRFRNMRTGVTTCYGHGITIDDHMKVCKLCREYQELLNKHL
jgi:hypothetical protein